MLVSDANATPTLWFDMIRAVIGAATLQGAEATAPPPIKA